MGIGAALAVGGTALSAGAQMYGASKAADAQTASANAANALQSKMFDQTQKNIAPYLDFGQRAGNKLFDMFEGGNALKPFNPTMGDLEKTPGYQFTLDQGLKAVNNANSAKGWGLSGAGQKGIADYASGLASQTYQQQFNNYWANTQNAGNLLMPFVSQGANAAIGQGNISAGVGQNMGNNLIGAGNAQGAASIASGNAIANAPLNALTEYRMFDQTMNPEKYGFGSGAFSALTSGRGL